MHVYFEWKTNDRTVLNNERPLTKSTISECNMIISRSQGNIICSVAKTRAGDLISNRLRKLKFTSIKLAQISRGGDSQMNPAGMIVVSLRGVNWSRLRCFGESANIFSC